MTELQMGRLLVALAERYTGEQDVWTFVKWALDELGVEYKESLQELH